MILPLISAFWAKAGAADSAATLARRALNAKLFMITDPRKQLIFVRPSRLPLRAPVRPNGQGGFWVSSVSGRCHTGGRIVSIVSEVFFRLRGGRSGRFRALFAELLSARGQLLAAVATGRAGRLAATSRRDQLAHHPHQAGVERRIAAALRRRRGQRRLEVARAGGPGSPRRGRGLGGRPDDGRRDLRIFGESRGRDAEDGKQCNKLFHARDSK